MEVIVLEERIDAIAYDDDWQVSEPEPAVLREAEEEEEQELHTACDVYITGGRRLRAEKYRRRGLPDGAGVVL